MADGKWHGSRQIVELTSKEFRAYISGGGDLAVVPVGSVEPMGRHLPLLSGVYLAEAVAAAIAEVGDGIILPTVPYSTVYDARLSAGAVHVDPKVMHNYLYDLCGELRANGFARVVFVSLVTELYYLSNEYFENENFAPVWMNPGDIEVPGTADDDERRTWLVAGALRLVGREDLLAKVTALNGSLYPEQKPSPRQDPRFAVMRRVGRVGYTLAPGEADFPAVAKVDADAGAAAIRSYAEGLADALKALGEYNGYLTRRRFDRGVK